MTALPFLTLFKLLVIMFLLDMRAMCAFFDDRTVTDRRSVLSLRAARLPLYSLIFQKDDENFVPRHSESGKAGCCSLGF